MPTTDLGESRAAPRAFAVCVFGLARAQRAGLCDRPRLASSSGSDATGGPWQRIAGPRRLARLAMTR